MDRFGISLFDSTGTPFTCHLGLCHITIWNNKEASRINIGHVLFFENLATIEQDGRLHVIASPEQDSKFVISMLLVIND